MSKSNGKQKLSEADAVAAAEATLARLATKRAELAGRINEYEAAVKRLAYRAHGASDAEASKELSTARDELRDLERKLGEFDAAIIEARVRLVDAKRLEARAAEAETAKALRAELKHFIAFAQSLDECLAALSDYGHELQATLNRIHQLGCPYPNNSQLFAFGSRALMTGLMKTPWSKELGHHLAPSERRSFADLVSVWAASAESNFVRPRLSESESEAEGAAA